MDDMKNLGLPDGGLYLMTDIVREREKRLTLSLSTLGLTLHEWRALRILYNFKDDVAMSEVVKYSQTDRTAFGRTIDRLETRGWVTRTPSTTDKRAIYLRTTKESKVIFAQALALVDKFDSELVKKLEPSEQEIMHLLLKKIHATLD